MEEMPKSSFNAELGQEQEKKDENPDLETVQDELVEAAKLAELASADEENEVSKESNRREEARAAAWLEKVADFILPRMGYSDEQAREMTKKAVEEAGGFTHVNWQQFLYNTPVLEGGSRTPLERSMYEEDAMRREEEANIARQAAEFMTRPEGKLKGESAEEVAALIQDDIDRERYMGNLKRRHGEEVLRLEEKGKQLMAKYKLSLSGLEKRRKAPGEEGYEEAEKSYEEQLAGLNEWYAENNNMLIEERNELGELTQEDARKIANDVLRPERFEESA